MTSLGVSSALYPQCCQTCPVGRRVLIMSLTSSPTKALRMLLLQKSVFLIRELITTSSPSQGPSPLKTPCPPWESDLVLSRLKHSVHQPWILNCHLFAMTSIFKLHHLCVHVNSLLYCSNSLFLKKQPVLKVRRGSDLHAQLADALVLRGSLGDLVLVTQPYLLESPEVDSIPQNHGTRKDKF